MSKQFTRDDYEVINSSSYQPPVPELIQQHEAYAQADALGRVASIAVAGGLYIIASKPESPLGPIIAATGAGIGIYGAQKRDSVDPFTDPNPLLGHLDHLTILRDPTKSMVHFENQVNRALDANLGMVNTAVDEFNPDAKMMELKLQSQDGIPFKISTDIRTGALESVGFNLELPANAHGEIFTLSYVIDSEGQKPIISREYPSEVPGYMNSEFYRTALDTDFERAANLIAGATPIPPASQQ